MQNSSEATKHHVWLSVLKGSKQKFEMISFCFLYIFLQIKKKTNQTAHSIKITDK